MRPNLRLGFARCHHPAVVGSLTLAGNIAYIWRPRPHAAFRIVLLIANGVWLSIYGVGARFSVYVLAKHDYAVGEAIATTLCASSSWPATSTTSGALAGTHIKKKGPAHRTRQLLSYSRQAMHRSRAWPW